MSKKNRKKKTRETASSSTPQPGNRGTVVAEKRSSMRGSTEVRMVKHLNTRFLIILSSICFTLGIGVYFLHGYQVKRTSSVLLDDAKTAEKGGDFDKAIELLTQYIRLNPGDLEAIAMLGKLIDESPPTWSSRNRALNLYSQLIREAPDREDSPRIRYRLVQLMMSLGEFTQAENQIAKLLKLPALPETSDGQNDFDRARLLFLQGQCEVQFDRPDEALASMLAAVTENSKAVEYYSGAIDVARNLGDDLPQREQFQDLLKQVPRNVETVPTAMLACFPAEDIADEENPDEAIAHEPSKLRTTEEILQTAAQPLIHYLLQQIAKEGRPRFEARLALAEYYLQQNDFDQVTAELDQIPQDERDEPEVTLFESRFSLARAERYADQGKRSEALEEFGLAERAAMNGKTSDPFDLRYDLLLADAGLRRYQFEKEPDERQLAILNAQKVLQSAIDDLPAVRNASLGIEDLHERDQRFLLLNELEVMLRMQLIQLELTLIESPETNLEQVPQLETVETAIDELEELTRNRGLLQFVKARKKFVVLQRRTKVDGSYSKSSDEAQERGSWGDVIADLKQVRLLIVDEPYYRRSTDLMLNRCYQELNHDQARLSLLQDAFERDTNWRQGRLELARALQANGRYEEANQHLVTLWKQLGVQAAPPEIVRTHIQYQLTLPQEKRDWNNVGLLLAELRESNPDNVALRLLEVEMMYQQGRFDDADHLLSDTLQLADLTQEDRVIGWLNRIRFQLFRGDLELSQNIQQATQLWNEARQDLDDCVDLDLVELMIAGRNSDEDLETAANKFAEELDNKKSKFAKYEDKERVKAIETLIAAFRRLDQTENETAMWAKLAKLQPERLQCQLALCRHALKEDNGDDFQDYLAEIRRIEGAGGPEGDFLEASWHALKFSQTPEELQHYERALRLLDSVEDRRPGWDRVPVARFYLAGLLNENEKQAEFAREAISLGAREPAIVEFRLAHLNRENRHQEAISLAERVRQERPNSFTTTMQNQLTSAYFRENELDEAFSLLRKSVEDGAEYQQLLTEGLIKLTEYELSEVYTEKTEARDLEQLLEECEKFFLDAIEKAPKEGVVWTRSVLFYLKTGRRDEAAQIVERAAAEMPSEPVAVKARTLAECHGLLGQTEEAIQQYSIALKADENNVGLLQQVAVFAERAGDAKLAKRAWQQIYDLTKDSSPTLAKRAQTVLSHLNVLESNTYAQAVKSIQELERSLPAEGDLRYENLVTQARILGRFPVRDFQTKLANVLAEIDSTRPLPIFDRMNQVRLDRALNRDGLADQKIEKLLEDEGQLLMVRAYAAEHYLRYDDPEKLALAREQIEYLRGRLPKSFLLTSLEARLAHSDKQSDRQPNEIIQDYLSHLNETQTGETIFRESIARNATGGAFNWLNQVPSIQNLTNQKKIREASRLLSEGEINSARSLLKPLLEHQDVRDFFAADSVRDCSGLLERFGMLSEAEQVYRKYLSMTTDENAPPLLISLLARQGKVEEAIRFSDSILTKENAPLVVTNLEATLRTQQVSQLQQEHIVAMFDRALAFDPKNVAVLHQRADYQDFKGDYDAAENTYLLILSIQPNYPVALNNFAWLLSMRKQSTMRTAQARKMIDHVIDVYGPSAELLDTKATVEMSAGNYTAAIELLERSIEAAPSANKYLRLSRAQAKAGHRKDAQTSYNKAVREGFDPAELHPLEQRQIEDLRDSLVVRD